MSSKEALRWIRELPEAESRERYFRLCAAHPEPFPAEFDVWPMCVPTRSCPTWRLKWFRWNRIMPALKYRPNEPDDSLWPTALRCLDAALAYRDAAPVEDHIWFHSAPHPSTIDDPKDRSRYAMERRHPPLSPDYRKHPRRFLIPAIDGASADLRHYRDTILAPLIDAEPGEAVWQNFVEHVDAALAWRATVPPEDHFWKPDPA